MLRHLVCEYYRQKNSTPIEFIYQTYEGSLKYNFPDNTRMRPTKNPNKVRIYSYKFLRQIWNIADMISDKVPFAKRVQLGRSMTQHTPYDAFPTAKFVIFDIKCLHKLYKNIYNIRLILTNSK